MNKKVARLLGGHLQLYFGCMLMFAAITAFFNRPAAGGELLIIALLYLYHRNTIYRRQKEVLTFIDRVSYNMDAASKDTMLNAPLPMVIFRPDSDEVIWSNDRFLALTGAQEIMFDTKLSIAVPGFSTRWLMEGKSECPTEVVLRGRRFLVFGHLVRTDDSGAKGLLATTYWVDVTELSDIRDRYQSSRPMVAIITLDNYEEICKGISDNAKSALMADIDEWITNWAAPTEGLLCKYDRDRYVFVFEARHLAALQEAKFSVLDSVHQVVSANGIPATLSIGMGKDAHTLQELFHYASLSTEMALSRGGDQAVVKNQIHFEFFGGRSKELEKRTKVKSRVMANAIGVLVEDASRLFIMGHKYPDLDSIGAAAGICALARKKGVPAHIVRDPDPNPATAMVGHLAQLPEYSDIFITVQDAMIMTDAQSLLVVVDTNRPEQVQSEDLLASCTKVAVIDHHLRAATYIADAALNFYEPYASSASELVTELLQHLVDPADLLRAEAEALLAGIVLDTKNFTMRTGGNTFEAAAFLRRSGADTGEVKKMFQNDLDATLAKYDIIRNVHIYHKSIAVAASADCISRVTAAQAADELLSISDVEASFVLFPDNNRVIVSARSNGPINVQVILEKLGGGGNAATAGAQIPSDSLENTLKNLLTAIDGYLDE